MTVKSLPDITPNGAATPLSATPVAARWIQVGCSGASGRAGDASVGAARGSIIPNQSSATQLPLQIGYTIQEGQGTYDLSQVFVFATGSDKISVTFGQ